MPTRVTIVTPTEIKEREGMRRNQVIGNLMASRPEQLEAYVDTNATNLAGVRAILKIILKVLVILLRREFRTGT